mmetsp:Transcript_19856/g.54846  ORF Transcript_19856/g.54846 Transcript_19856/m.54846 type:complete len:213 (-) Transcript_19856:106-744(-)
MSGKGMEKAGRDCKVKLFDFDVVSAYFGTCNEYMRILANPFDPIPFTRLVCCSQSDWASAYTEWGVLQFFISIIVNVVTLVLFIIVWTGQWFLYLHIVVQKLVLSYLVAHYGWFAVAKKEGCCCFIILCCEGHIVLVIWGILVFLLGAYNIFLAVLHIDLFPLAFILVILNAIHGVVLVYMGFCALMLWNTRGSDGLRNVTASVVGNPVGTE